MVHRGQQYAAVHCAEGGQKVSTTASLRMAFEGHQVNRCNDLRC